MRKRSYWKIEGYNGTEKIFESLVPTGNANKNRITTLLQRLVCRHLNEAEIISSSLRPKSKEYTSLLETTISFGTRSSIMAGSDPHYVASLWSEAELKR